MNRCSEQLYADWHTQMIETIDGEDETNVWSPFASTDFAIKVDNPQALGANIARSIQDGTLLTISITRNRLAKIPPVYMSFNPEINMVTFTCHAFSKQDTRVQMKPVVKAPKSAESIVKVFHEIADKGPIKLLGLNDAYYIGQDDNKVKSLLVHQSICNTDFFGLARCKVASP